MVDLPHDQELADEDLECQIVQVAPRVSLADLQGAIDEVHYSCASVLYNDDEVVPPDHPLRLMTLCALVLKNGFVVIGKSACASPANFNAELGNRLAYRDAIRQTWPLLGYKLRDDLYRHGLHKFGAIELGGSTGPAKSG